MADKQIINSCEFQSQCIEYKDMYSYKHMKCPIVDFAIACRGENKCKYKTVYEMVKQYKQNLTEIKKIVIDTGEQIPPFDWGKTSDNLKQILQKISECEVLNYK